MIDSSLSMTQTRWWAQTWRFLLPILFGITAVLISVSLYQHVALQLDALSAPSELYRAFHAILAFNITLIVLLAFTYLLLQIRSFFMQQSEKQNADRTSFLRMAADGLRTPLTGLRWLTELLLGEDFGQINEKQRQSILRMSNAIERLILQINELLKIMKLSGGLIHYRPKPMHIRSLVEEAIDDVHGLAEAKRQRILLSPTAPDVLLPVDGPLIRHVFDVLLSNAIHLSLKSAVIDAETAITAREAVVRISYENEVLNPAYFSGATALSHMTREETGHGVNLELTVSQEILFAAGGRLELEHDKSKHAFVVTLPREQKPVPSAINPPSLSSPLPQ